MFRDVVWRSKPKFEAILDAVEEKNAKLDTDLTAEDLKEVIRRFKELYRKKRAEFPQDPRMQLMEAVKAVFRSWENPKPSFTEGSIISRATGAQRKRTGNGLRQYGQRFGTGVAFTGTRPPVKGNCMANT